MTGGTIKVRGVCLGIRCGREVVQFPGVTVKEPRPGWINLRIPTAEVREDSLARLPKTQRDRIEDASIYELLQREVARRLPARSG